jgi:predicted O-linked N-acetylglucosamine transferase (SPINDLY family)
MVNRAAALIELRRYREALAGCEQALARDEGYALAHYNRAIALEKLKRYDEAIASCRRARELDPGLRNTLGLLAQCLLHACDWSETGTLLAELTQHVRERQSNIMPLVFLSYSEDAALQAACAANYLAHLVPHSPQPLPPRPVQRCERVRLAYLSADYHHHATAYLMAELFERHDRSRFEVLGLSFGPSDDSDMRARLVKAFDGFHDLRGMSDRAAAELMRAHEIDIAIDLKGHTSDARPGILAYRSAPVQVSYLGYPGTMGADFIDYILADATVLPFDQQAFYAEKIVHLPDCYQVNDRRRRIAERTPTRAEAGLPPEGFVFCCFNNSFKITAPVFDIWMGLLRAVDGSVLWLLRDNAAAETNLRHEAAARGIDPRRLVFAPRMNLADHLARHRLADLFLDTLPYNAHTTASDALWAGLPVLTCCGQSFAGRVAASLLQAAGLGELVTQSLADYRALALRFATDRAFAHGLRQQLARNLPTCPLFDTDRFRRHIEQAYAQMWDTCLRGDQRHAFAVASDRVLDPPPPSWPGLSRPSTSVLPREDMDARHEAGHDDRETGLQKPKP